jgi:hypothetical protein
MPEEQPDLLKELPAEGAAGALSPVKRRLLQSALAIEAAQDPASILFQHTCLCQTGLPYRDPGPGVTVWDRQQGAISLRIRAGEVQDENAGGWRSVGLPFGPKPRVILSYLNATAIRTGSPEIEVEDSLTAFVKRIGLASKGKNMLAVKDQLARLSTAEVRMSLRYEENRQRQVQTHIVAGFDLWFPKDRRQRVLWPSTVRLSLDYFASLQHHAVPLDERAIAALSHSAMGLDVYCWLAQRLHRVSPGRPQLITWRALRDQFGHGYGRLVEFRRVFRRTLGMVLSQYAGARLDDDERGLLLHHSPPPVRARLAPVRGL